MPRANEWQSRFGASRRAKDKAYCQAAERAIAMEMDYAARDVPLPSNIKPTLDDNMRASIARAFGRPLN